MINLKKGIYVSVKFKSLFCSLLTVAFIFSFFALAFSQTGRSKGKNVSSQVLPSDLPLIIVDPGHGGEDGGTSSAEGVVEKDINLVISNKIDILLTLCGYDTLMTRNEDKLLYDGEPSTMRSKKVADIKKRMTIVENNPESIFLSIHQNYFTQSKYSGAQVFYSANNAESKIIADSIQGSIKADIQNDNQRKTKKSGKEIYLLYHAESPAVMVECGFMSNPDEARLLCDEEYQIKMSVSIIDGLNDYLKAKGEL